MPDFWRTSGFHLLRRDAAGKLAVTDDFLRAYLARPELHPTDESCPAETALYAALVEEPRRQVAPEALAALADPDARTNYEVFVGFRDRLAERGSVEAAYLSLFRGEPLAVPPLFVDQLAHAILRGVLDGCDDPIRVRAAELLFRSQRVNIQDGSIMVADEETVEMQAAAGGEFGTLAGLLAGEEPARRSVELDVLDAGNAAVYWERSDRFDTVLDIAFTRPGLDGLCRVLEAWVAHLVGVRVAVQPVRSVKDERWVWHVGLDAEASGLLNDLYEGVEVAEERLARLLALFRLEFPEPDAMLPRVRGRPVYMGMAMTPGGVLRLKPQNLLVNLPLARTA